MSWRPASFILIAKDCCPIERQARYTPRFDTPSRGKRRSWSGDGFAGDGPDTGRLRNRSPLRRSPLPRRRRLPRGKVKSQRNIPTPRAPSPLLTQIFCQVDVMLDDMEGRGVAYFYDQTRLSDRPTAGAWSRTRPVMGCA